MQTQGGKMPPDVAHPPSLFEQVSGPGSKVEHANGYTNDIDPAGRTQSAHGELTTGPVAARSRNNQASAGGGDRLITDDGGHFIAARFNGRSEAFNHFAQDANFNRGEYRALEDKWAADLRAGERVTVDIIASYPGKSRRPDQLNVGWTIAGTHYRKRFNNGPGGK